MPQNVLVKQVALSLLFFGRCVLIFSFFWSLFCFFFLSFFFSLSLSFVNCFIVYKEEGREDKRSEEEEEEEIREEEEALFVLLFFYRVFCSFSLSRVFCARALVLSLSLSLRHFEFHRRRNEFIQKRWRTGTRKRSETSSRKRL